MSDDLKTGDKVTFRAFGDIWLEGIIDHIYETSQDVVIKTEFPNATYERKRKDVQKIE